MMNSNIELLRNDQSGFLPYGCRDMRDIPTKQNYTLNDVKIVGIIFYVRNRSSPFHGIRANGASAREKKGMWALEEVALRMIKQCNI